MRGLVQRVTEARVAVGNGVASNGVASNEVASNEVASNEVVGQIGAGLCVLVGVTHDDDEAAATKMASKIWGLRVFDDDDGVMNRSVGDAGGQVLVISQFTLYGDTSKGRRPSWIDAARPEQAEPLVDRVVDELRSLGASVATGRFQAEMQVSLVNDGPVTLLIET